MKLKGFDQNEVIMTKIVVNVSGNLGKVFWWMNRVAFCNVKQFQVPKISENAINTALENIRYKIGNQIIVSVSKTFKIEMR